jgi:hypothetical protein
LVHDHLQSCCSCCCQIWEHAGSLPRLISHSSLTHKHICNINTHTHTHTHTYTNKLLQQHAHKSARSTEFNISSMHTCAQTHRQQWVSPIWLLAHYPSYGASG